MKKSISSKIIISYIVIILASIVLVSIFFNIAAKKYMERKISEDLKEDIKKVALSIKNEINTIKKDTQTNNESLDARWQIIIKSIISQKKLMFTLDSNYAVFTKDRIIFPKNSAEEIKFRDQILPVIKKKIASNKENYSKIRIDGNEYVVVFAPMNLTADAKTWLSLYAPIEPAKQLRKGILMVLLVPLVVTGLISIVFGAFFARSIAKPIIMLRNRAEMISKRDFDTKVEVKTGDELEELASSINIMAIELKQYDIAQKKFLQNASHELKTPLMSIQGYAEGVKDGVFDNNDQALDIIVAESNRLKNIVEELIFLSKLETFEDFYNFTNEKMNEVIEKSVEKIGSIATKTNIKINQMLYKDSLMYLDKDKFTQALINIYGNCLRYAKSEINITTSNDGNWYEIVINDDGEGFEDKDLKNVFERFYKGNKGNTGLGMAITKVIIEKHQGVIEVLNGLNGGAEFKIKLKIK